LIKQNEQLQLLVSSITHKVNNDYYLSLSEEDLKSKTLNRKLQVSIVPDKGYGGDYYQKQKIHFRVSATRDCYIKVIYLSSISPDSGLEKKISTMLFPNIHDKNNFVRGGQTAIIGKHGELEIDKPFGKDVITVIASERQFTDIDNSLSQTQGTYYSEATSSTRGAIHIRKRGIVVTDKAESYSVPETKSEAALTASATCFIISHPSIGGSTTVPPKQGLVLFSKEQAKQLNLSDEEWGQPVIRTRSIAKGPNIEIKNPRAIQPQQDQEPIVETVPPADLELEFKTNRSPINMASVQVIAKKGFLSFPLTDRLKPYIKGTAIIAKKINIPKGRFRIKVSIADQKGAETIKSYRLLIK
jgi:hypothetical protein